MSQSRTITPEEFEAFNKMYGPNGTHKGQMPNILQELMTPKKINPIQNQEV